MKTAISLPDRLFHRAEAMARRLGVPRSQLYAAAIDEYLATHSHDHVTTALDEVYTEQDSTLNPAFTQRQSSAIPDEYW